MTTVAVTGASGYIGRRVLETLDRNPDVTRVVGIDVVDPAFSTRNLEFYRLDVRSPSLGEVVRGCDVLIHLAFAGSGRDLEEMRDTNVGGTRSALAAAVEAGIGKIVHVSTVMAYGAHPDNDFPLTESSPIRGVREFAYSAQAAEVEALVEGFREAHAGVTLTVLRPGVVLGPSVSGLMARMLETPWVLTIAGYEPPVQFVHETDVARAVEHAVREDLDGAYNVCPDGWLSQDRTIELLGRRRMAVDYEDAVRRAGRLSRLGLSELPPESLPFLMYPWVMSNRKLTDTGFGFLHTNESALLAAAESRRGWVALGKLRFRPRDVAALAGAIVVGGSIARRRTRSRA